MDMKDKSPIAYCTSTLNIRQVCKTFCILCILLLTHSVRAVITIQSISTTPSECANQGTATITAISTPDPFLMYELISGPSLAPRQNNSKFSSLFPGTYTVRVYDSNENYKDQDFTITGNYMLPDLDPSVINPTCINYADGSITATPAAGTGRAPFTWELISPVASAPQATSTFTGLTQGTYVVKITDACMNYQTRTVFLTAGGTGLARFFDGVPNVSMIGCDTVAFFMYIALHKEKAKKPLTLTITTSSGTYTRQVFAQPIDTINYVPGFFQINDTIPGITYNSYLNACITDTCGQSICGQNTVTSPFEFDIHFNRTVSCENKLSAYLLLKNPPMYPYIATSVKYPVTLTLKDAVTNKTVDSSVFEYPPLLIREQTKGRTYHLKVVDGCGKIFQQTIVWPIPAPPFVQTSVNIGCMDSTASAYFDVYNFDINTRLEIISGPSRISSSKRKYAFSDTITYPKTITSTFGGGFSIKNMAEGVYQYRVYDTCGNEVNGSLTILPHHLADFNYSYKIKNGCLGNSILSFDPRSNNTISVYINRTSDNMLLYERKWFYETDSLMSLTPDKYSLKIHYGNDPFVGGSHYDGKLNDNISDCWAMIDTITISPYNSNSFQSNTTIFCNGSSYVQLNVDSSRGVAPYQFEVIRGPQTYHWQGSNVFQLPSYGTYDIRIRDACNNTSIRQITVDSAKFPPVVKRGASCSGSKIVLKGISSPYFTYEWYMPDGSVFTGDSLVINPLTAADTGIYNITKTVNYNGCTDAFHSTYHLSLFDEVSQTLCDRVPVQVGTNVYTTAGIYTDTLTNSLGCDSIVHTTLLSIPQNIQTNNISICYGDQYGVGTNTYTLPGIYKDSTINRYGCFDITVTNLTVNGIPDTLIRTICEGDMITHGNSVYTATGVYPDTLSSASGCDSIIVLHLTVHPKPVVNLGNNTSLCDGESVLLEAGSGYTSYSWNGGPPSPIEHSHEVQTTGTFWIVVENQYGCSASDTIEIQNIYPVPVADAGPDDTICTGESVQLSASGGLYYNWSSSDDLHSTITVHPTSSTIYIVTAYNVHGCSASDSVKIFVHTLPAQQVFENNSIRHCFDDGTVELNAEWGKSFLWMPTGETTQRINVSQEGVWNVLVTDENNCNVNAQIEVIEYCETKIFIPEAFSPNGDGLHDDLEVFGKNFTHFSFTIFNRWGEIIFVSEDRNIRWNGMYRNEEMPVGSYPWIIRYRKEFDDAQEEFSMSGNITLIR